MSSDPDKLHDRVRETISNLRDEDLIHVVQSTSGEYTRFAHDVAHEEIERRGGEVALRRRLTEKRASTASEEAESVRASRLKPLTTLISTECYIEVWEERNFEGESLIIKGPGEIPDLCANHMTWCSRIRSLRVGPQAFVLAYAGKGFKGDVIRLGPSEEVTDLSNVKFDEHIDSIKIVDSIKVFDCTSSSSETKSRPVDQTSDPGEEDSTENQSKPPASHENRRHKRRWR